MKADGVVVTLDQDVFEALQARARPLVDDTNSVLRRLLASSQDGPDERRPATVTLARGEQLPVGLRLRARYRGHLFTAEVTSEGIRFEGQDFQSPSDAATAAKLKLGARRPAALTNGWTFWRATDPATGAEVRLENLRRPRRRFASVAIVDSGKRDTARRAGDVRYEPRSWR
jgi:hypothetical protein